MEGLYHQLLSRSCSSGAQDGEGDVANLARTPGEQMMRLAKRLVMLRSCCNALSSAQIFQVERVMLATSLLSSRSPVKCPMAQSDSELFRGEDSKSFLVKLDVQVHSAHMCVMDLYKQLFPGHIPAAGTTVIISF